MMTALFRKGKLILTVCMSLITINNNINAQEKNITGIIPVPEKYQVEEGYFNLTDRILLSHKDDNEINVTAGYLQKILKDDFNISCESGTGDNNIIILVTDKSIPDNEGYTLEINKTEIKITGASSAGIFNGIQSLRQIINNSAPENNNRKIKCVFIQDKPVLDWRGFMLDVSRHFFPKEFIIRLIDILALHKLNKLHLHLVDDQGWRIEIKKYPLLTEVGAWRVDREHLDWNERPLQKEGEKATYGGFYSQQDIKEIIKYAQERNIEVIPEIEMPAHTVSSLAAYPELSCTGNKITVLPGSYWPNRDLYCAGKETTFSFLEDVLQEVAGLFPSKYIHIGGDEADYSQWEKCPDCQKKMKELNLNQVSELQSYFIERINKYIKKFNKQLIGWDEVFERGISKDVTVMTWRDIKFGTDAAKAGYKVLMSPTSNLYFDYYQGDMDTEPQAIGGYTPLSKVYDFNPLPDELNDQQKKNIIGIQANLWTEFIGTTNKAEYMILPRLAALSEVAWSNKNNKNYNDFINRLQGLTDYYKMYGYNYSKSAYNVTGRLKPVPENKAVLCEMLTEIPDAEIYYTRDNTEPTINSLKYISPFEIKESVMLKAKLFKNGEAVSTVYKRKIEFHKALYKNILLTNVPVKYTGGDEYALVNGLNGSKNFGDGNWCGFEGNDLDALIDLGETTGITSVSISFLHNPHSWIFRPEYVKLEYSEDGKEFKQLDEYKLGDNENKPGIINYNKEVNIKARYIKVFGKNIEKCPPSHYAAGGKAWLFVDEIIVR